MIGKLFTTSNKKIALISVIICSSAIAYNFTYIVNQFQILQPLPYLRGEITRDQYISKFYPEYPIIQYANSYIPTDTKVLCLYLGNRGYYMDFRPIFDKISNPSLIKEVLSKASRGTDISKQLIDKNILYILLRNDLTEIWINQLNKNDFLLIKSFFEIILKR